MKIISLNVRGLGGTLKRRYINNLVSKEQTDMVCLQEAKCIEFSREKVCLFWGSNEVDWVVNKANNSVGGVLTIWNNKLFQMSNYVNGRNFSIIEGSWKVGNGVLVTIVNVYCSSSLRERKEVWEEINGYRLNQLSKAWCVVGDFNSIRRQKERKSMISETDYSREIKGFNEFIEKSKLVDIPLVGRKFTWYKPNGMVKRRIDRVLVSKEWLNAWPRCQQFVLNRSISDHCAVVLKEMSVDWGLRPFRCLDVWQKDNRFKDFVRRKWVSYEVQGRGIYIFKEKLKKLKVDLKVWNKEDFGDVNLASEELLKRINVLDAQDDVRGLVESEREEKNFVS